MKFELSVIIPTLNEENNIQTLYAELCSVLTDTSWQVIYVDDDSTDRTRNEIKELARAHSNVQLIHRIRRRGLSSACLEGMAASDSDYILVMDADLQHDSSVIPDMLTRLKHGDFDLVIGSRFQEDSKIAGLSLFREKSSRFVNAAIKKISGKNLTDPLSGFFAMKRGLYDEVRYNVSGVGFKILIDIILSSPSSLKIDEVSFTFRERLSGDSKLDISIVSEFIGLIIEKLSKGNFPIRFLSFICVGCVGALGHFTMMLVLYQLLDYRFALSQLASTYFAIVINFYLNNIFTYRSGRLKGLAKLKGLLLFILVCSAGALNSLIVAEALYKWGIFWPIASLSGAIYGSVWNYFMSSILVWFKKPTVE
ncbi:glycosyltransferase family 2 protein [Coraliomargarita sp. W4R53]